MYHYCILCGVRLVPYPGPLPADPVKRLDWRREIRAGIGFFDSTALLASNNANASYADSQHDLERHYLQYSSPTKSWTFAFHDACWQILLAKVAPLTIHHQEPLRIAEHLFNLVFCLPWDRCYVTFPAHDFGGASQFWKSPANLPEPWAFLLADPNKLSLIPSAKALHAAADFFPIPAEASADCFSRLSLEVNHLVVVFLESSDLCNLRLSSKTIANLTKPSHLPQSFWASRFAADKEMGFFFFSLDCESTSSLNLRTDWRGLYFDIKHALRDRTQAGHVRNRRRIWQSLGHLTRCLIPLLNQKSTLRDNCGIDPKLASRGYEAGQLAQGLARQDDSRCSGMGMRLFGTQCLLFRAAGSEAKSIQISVSFITFNCTDYVCGMRVFKRDGIYPTTELSSAGLIIPCSEIQIPIMPQNRLTGIRVASSICGIVGLGFRFEDEAGHTSSKTAGMVDNPPDGVGIFTLEPRGGYRVSGAIIGLDACKFVSVQLLEHRLDPIAPKGNPTSMVSAMPWFWHPAEPDPPGNKPIWFCTPESQQTAHEPTFVLNMDFGGPGGTQLSRLNRVVAFHDDSYGSFRGFAFFYIDGNKKVFGMRDITDTASNRWTCIEQSFALDGPGGERIINLEFGQEEAARGNCLRVVKMVTSHGRLLEFQRWYRHSDASKSHTERSLEPSAEETITGMLATVQLSTGSLQCLGLRCLADAPGTSINSPPKPPARHDLDVQDSHSFPIDQAHLKKAPLVLQNSSSCFTSVTLSNIRRVGLSTGIPGRTRGADHVSGLCFEFWDLSVPIYVGQWFHEVAHLQLEPGERIAGFTFWQTQESNPANTQRENSGRITGIRIDKTGLEPREVEFCLGDKNDMLTYSFTENPFEELKGLVWGFSHQCDYIYVLTQPPKSRLGTVLALHNMLGFWANSRIPGKLFWQVQDHEANWLRVSRIHAVFNNNDKRLSGFVFEYGSGQICRHAGHIQGVMASMSLKDGERVTRMDVLTGISEHDVIRFHTSANRVWALSAPSSNPEPKHQQSSDFEVFIVDEPHGPKTDGAPASRGTLAELSRTPDGGNCVGIWVTMKIFPRAMNIVEAVGLIFTKWRE